MKRLLFASAIFLSSTVHAQSITVALRAGAMNVAAGSRSYEAVYDNPTPLVGVKVQIGQRWFAALAADYARSSGEQVIFDPESIGTGITSELTILPVQLSVGRRFGRVALALGPSFLRLSESSEFGSISQSKDGGHVMVSMARQTGRWVFGGDLLYMHVPGILGPGGTAGFFNERDLSAVILQVSVGYRWR